MQRCLKWFFFPWLFESVGNILNFYEDEGSIFFNGNGIKAKNLPTIVERICSP